MGVIERALEIHYSTFPRALPVMRWHDLRASTITVLLDQGVDLLTIQRIVGHRDLATTRRYVGKTPTAMVGGGGQARGGDGPVVPKFLYARVLTSSVR